MQHSHERNMIDSNEYLCWISKWAESVGKGPNSTVSMQARQNKFDEGSQRAGSSWEWAPCQPRISANDGNSDARGHGIPWCCDRQASLAVLLLELYCILLFASTLDTTKVAPRTRRWLRYYSCVWRNFDYNLTSWQICLEYWCWSLHWCQTFSSLWTSHETLTWEFAGDWLQGCASFERRLMRLQKSCIRTIANQNTLTWWRPPFACCQWGMQLT